MSNGWRQRLEHDQYGKLSSVCGTSLLKTDSENLLVCIISDNVYFKVCVRQGEHSLNLTAKSIFFKMLVKGLQKLVIILTYFNRLIIYKINKFTCKIMSSLRIKLFFYCIMKYFVV